jgi:hypothetical protein
MAGTFHSRSSAVFTMVSTVASKSNLEGSSSIIIAGARNQISSAVRTMPAKSPTRTAMAAMFMNQSSSTRRMATVNFYITMLEDY